MHGQFKARPMITFTTARHQRPLATVAVVFCPMAGFHLHWHHLDLSCANIFSTKLNYTGWWKRLVCVKTSESGMAEIRTVTCWSEVQCHRMGLWGLPVWACSSVIVSGVQISTPCDVRDGSSRSMFSEVFVRLKTAMQQVVFVSSALSKWMKIDFCSFLQPSDSEYYLLSLFTDSTVCLFISFSHYCFNTVPSFSLYLAFFSLILFAVQLNISNKFSDVYCCRCLLLWSDCSLGRLSKTSAKQELWELLLEQNFFGWMPFQQFQATLR